MDKLKKLQTLYDSLPELKCKGLCYESCGPIGMEPIEVENISNASHEIPTVNKEFVCSALVNNRCSIYEQRPAVCRLYGMVPKLACPHGCRPRKKMTNNKGRKFLKEIQEIKSGASHFTFDFNRQLNLTNDNQ